MARAKITYFCLTKTSSYTKKTQQILYSAVCSVLHSDEIPMPVFIQLPSWEDEDENDTNMIEDIPKNYSNIDCVNSSITVNRNSAWAEFNVLIRDLSLSKELSELLISRLKDKNICCKMVQM